MNELFGNTLREQEKRELCSLIYYPEQKLELVKQNEPDINDWYHITLHQLVAVCRDVSSKYTRSKVRKSLPCDFSYIIQELLHEHTEDHDKTAYVNVIVDTIISTGSADDFIIAIANVIQRLAIDQLHILGDIYDRGPGAHIILDKMRRYHSWDIQWGNHDVLWMGAAAGNDACICNVIRLSLRYANLSTLEEGYGINLVPLATFAMETYKDDDCKEFLPKLSGGAAAMDEKTQRLTSLMHKAIAVIQFKLESQLFKKHPEWKMKDRRLFDYIDYRKGKVEIYGKEYEMTSCHFPTIDPENPDKLSEEEEFLIQKLHHSFMVCEKLHKHIKVMLQHGCMYAIFNNNLLFRCFLSAQRRRFIKRGRDISWKKFSGRALMHHTGCRYAQLSNRFRPNEKEYAIDYFLYLWCGPDSPLFDKSKMATFERYFITDKETHKEEKGYYFLLRDDEKVIDHIMDEFGVNGR